MTDQPASESRLVLLTQVYPFVRQRIQGGQAEALIQGATLLLLGYELTFAGSYLLQDPFARSFFRRLQLFFEKGIVRPDLRGEASSFEALAVLKRRPDLLPYARQLDDSVTSTISFSATEVSGSYRDLIGAYIDGEMDRSPEERTVAVLAQVKARLDALPDPIALEQAKEIFPRTSSFREARKTMEFLYCLTGAEVVRADALFHGTFRNQVGSLSGPPDAEVAHEATKAILEYFAIDVRPVIRLPPRRLLELRNDERVRQASKEIRSIARRFQEKVAPPTDNAAEAASALNAYVREACEREERLTRAESVVSDLALDQLPLSSFVRRAIIRLESVMAGTPKLSWLARSTAPISHFASILYTSLRGQ